MVGSTADAEDGLAEGGDGPFLSLDGFSGPLEQLLTLARARQVDLSRLSLNDLVDQLVTALQQASSTIPLGQKGDWVVMVAWLVQLRSLLLLPATAPARQAAELEADQLRARLLELRAMQGLSAWLEQRPQLKREVFARGQAEAFGVKVEIGQAVDVIEFLWASLGLFDDDLSGTDARAEYRPRSLDLYSVPDARARILERLVAAPDGCPLEALLPPVARAANAEIPSPLRRRSAWTSTFVASLELAKQGDVTLVQQSFLTPINVKAASPEVVGKDEGSDAVDQAPL